MSRYLRCACLVIIIIISNNNFDIAFCQDFKKCEQVKTCGECLQIIDCAWCIKTNNNGTHCGEKESAEDSQWCSKENIVDPLASQENQKDKNFSSDPKNTVQLKPQFMKVTLRKGEKVDVNFQYKQANNYPVDLYCIMDMSFSMEKHRGSLGNISEKIAEKMQQYTTDITLGFGSFIDKRVLPFSHNNGQVSCPHNLPNCNNPVDTYSYKNHLSLVKDTNKFKEAVHKAPLSGSIDKPEGGLDGLMQAMVCKNEIGWRQHARHLILFVTDSPFHIAGDGKLAGIINPNDATCHLTKNTTSNNEYEYVYDKYLEYDYPSTSQLNHVARTENMNIIFAVTNNTLADYKALSDNMENANYGELKDNNADDIINLIVKNFIKIVQRVSMKLVQKTQTKTDDVDVKISASCPNKLSDSECDNVHFGDLLNFKATIEVLNACSQPNMRRDTKRISIKPQNVEEYLEIELDVICDCDCSVNSVANSTNCNGFGDFQCGVCACQPGRFGDNCQCDGVNGTTKDIPECQEIDESNMLAWILGVILSIVIAGLIAIFIWKCVTVAQDKREFAKFEQDRQKLKWATSKNPYYKEVELTYKNPTYHRAISRE